LAGAKKDDEYVNLLYRHVNFDKNKSPILITERNSYARRGSTVGPSPSPVDGNPMNYNRTPQTIVAPHQDGTPPVTYPDAKFAQVATDSGTYTQFMRPKFARAPIKEAGRVAYLGWLIYEFC
jgi:hypothetical protein